MLRLDRLMPAFSARLTRSTWPASRTLLRLTAGAPVGSLTRLIVRAATGESPGIADCLSQVAGWGWILGITGRARQSRPANVTILALSMASPRARLTARGIPRRRP